jgi:hypothetical protein
MSDVLAVAAVVAFFALGALYVVACARILAGSGDIDAAPDDTEVATDEPAGTPAERELVG